MAGACEAGDVETFCVGRVRGGDRAFFVQFNFFALGTWQFRTEYVQFLWGWGCRKADFDW